MTFFFFSQRFSDPKENHKEGWISSPPAEGRKTVSHRPIHLHPNFPAPARTKLFPTGPYTCTHTLAPQLPSPSASKTVSHRPIHLHPYTCTPTCQLQREKNCLPRAHTLAPQLPSPSASKTVSHRPIHLHPNLPAPAREKLSAKGLRGGGGWWWVVGELSCARSKSRAPRGKKGPAE